eukprot:12982928-Alexandrium_andersonii.AAC.1
MAKSLEQKYYDRPREVPNGIDVPGRSPRTCADVAEDELASEVSEVSSGMNVLKTVLKHLVMKHRAWSISPSQHMKRSDYC